MFGELVPHCPRLLEACVAKLGVRGKLVCYGALYAMLLWLMWRYTVARNLSLITGGLRSMHATCLQHACNIHVTCVQGACNLHATHMQHTCNMHATCMLRACSTHATCLQHTYNMHATYIITTGVAMTDQSIQCGETNLQQRFMQHTCSMHATCLRHTGNMRAACMQHTWNI